MWCYVCQHSLLEPPCRATVPVLFRGGWALMQHQALSPPWLALVKWQRGLHSWSRIREEEPISQITWLLYWVSTPAHRANDLKWTMLGIHKFVSPWKKEAKEAFHENILPTLCPNKTQTCMGFDCSITTFTLFLLFFSSPLPLLFPRHFPPDLLFHPHHTQWSVDLTITIKQRHRDK